MFRKICILLIVLFGQLRIFCQTYDSTGYKSILASKDSAHEQVERACDSCNSNHFVVQTLVDRVIIDQLKSPMNISMINSRSNQLEANCIYRFENYYSSDDTISGLNIRIKIIGRKVAVRSVVKVIEYPLLNDTLIFFTSLHDSLITTTLGEFDSQTIIIDSIILQIGERVIMVDKYIYDKYLHVNFTNNYLHVKPISVFFDTVNNTINLYIFSYYKTSDNQNLTYMVKLIFDMEGGYIGKLEANDNLLWNYNCYYSKFIGF